MIDVLLAVANCYNELSGVIGQELSVLIQLEIPLRTTIITKETLFLWRHSQVGIGIPGYGWAGIACSNLNHSG